MLVHVVHVDITANLQYVLQQKPSHDYEKRRKKESAKGNQERERDR